MHEPHTHKQQACMHDAHLPYLPASATAHYLPLSVSLAFVSFFVVLDQFFFFTSDERMSTIRCYSIVMWLEWNAFSLSDVGSVAIFRPFSASSSSSQMQWIVMLCCWYPMRYMFGLLLVLCAGDRIIIWFFLLRMFDIHANYVLSFSRPLSHTHTNTETDSLFLPLPLSLMLSSPCALSTYVFDASIAYTYIYIHRLLSLSCLFVGLTDRPNDG